MYSSSKIASMGKTRTFIHTNSARILEQHKTFNIQLHKAFQAMSLRVESRRYFPPARKTQVIWQSHRNTITPREPTKGPPAEITTDWRDERCQPERKQKLPPSFATTQIQHTHDTSYF